MVTEEVHSSPPLCCVSQELRLIQFTALSHPQPLDSFYVLSLGKVSHLSSFNHPFWKIWMAVCFPPHFNIWTLLPLGQDSFMLLSYWTQIFLVLLVHWGNIRKSKRMGFVTLAQWNLKNIISKKGTRTQTHYKSLRFASLWSYVVTINWLLGSTSHIPLAGLRQCNCIHIGDWERSCKIVIIQNSIEILIIVNSLRLY